MTQKELIRQEIERRKKVYLTKNGFPKGTFGAIKIETYEGLLSFIDSLPEETSCIYDTNKFTPTPSVNIEDVARVQFASHAKVFDKKRKAVFDWEQFKEVAGIFYGFGKRDSLPEENNPEPYNPVYDEDYLNEKIAKATKSWEGVDVDKMLADCRGYEERPSDDLEEAAEEYADKHGFRVPYDGSNNYYDDVDVKASKEGFIAGAEWMAKQGVTFTAAVDHYEDFYLDSCDQEAEAIKKTWSKSDGLGNSSNTKEMNEIKQTSLKEAAEEYAYRGIPDEIKQNVKPIADEIIKQFIAGAEWMRKKDVEDMYMSDNRHFLKCYEQGKVDMRVAMMKDAVDGEIGYWNQRGLSIRLDQSLEKLGYGEDTEVKVIIVKQ